MTYHCALDPGLQNLDPALSCVNKFPNLFRGNLILIEIHLQIIIFLLLSKLSLLGLYQQIILDTLLGGPLHFLEDDTLLDEALYLGIEVLVSWI